MSASGFGSSLGSAGYGGNGVSSGGSSGGLASLPIVGPIFNTLEGNPQGASSQLSALGQQAWAQGQAVKNFLLGQEGNVQKYYQPMRQMFSNMYGTGGLMPAKAPGAPGGGAP